MIYNDLYDTNKIEKEIKRIGVPKEYRSRFVNLDNLFTHDYVMQLSIRQDAGKTTQALLLGLILHKLYGKQTCYMRSDNSQITMSKVSTLYDVIIDCDYVSKLYDGLYNSIVYKQFEHKFYLCNNSIDVNGKLIQEVSHECICYVASLEEHIDYKSTVNNPHLDYIIFDEFMDSKRATTRQMIELQNNISTFGRKRDTCHVIMLGNNVDRYCFWFEEFCIEDDIVNLSFGSYIERNTSLGTTFLCELLRMSDEHRDKVKNRKIRFSGFDTEKMNAFNGLSEWQGGAWPHIPDNDMLKEEVSINNIWISHRNTYIRINIYHSDECGYYVFMHYSNKPKYDDAIILSLSPRYNNEFYGMAEYAPLKLKKTMERVIDLIRSNKCYFSTNSVGELFNNFKHEYKVNKRALI